MLVFSHQSDTTQLTAFRLSVSRGPWHSSWEDAPGQSGLSEKKNMASLKSCRPRNSPTVLKVISALWHFKAQLLSNVSSVSSERPPLFSDAHVVGKNCPSCLNVHSHNRTRKPEIVRFYVCMYCLKPFLQYLCSLFEKVLICHVEGPVSSRWYLGTPGGTTPSQTVDLVLTKPVRSHFAKQ